MVDGACGATGARAAPRVESVSRDVTDSVTIRGHPVMAIRASESLSTTTYASLIVNVRIILFKMKRLLRIFRAKYQKQPN